MALTRRALLGAALAASSHGIARAADGPVTIGLLTDMSGTTRDNSGPGSVAATRLAIREFSAANPGIEVRLLVGDHQQKADIGAGIVRQWIDRDGLDAVLDVNNSAIAFAVNQIVIGKDKVHLNTGATSSDLTGAACNANMVHWTYDTWDVAHAISTATLRQGGDSWFFVAADYVFGHTTARDVSAFVTAGGGRVLGAVYYPFPSTSDFSSYLLQAQASGARVICLANSSDDFVNCVKQAHEFGITGQGVRLAGTFVFINDMHALGLETAQNLLLTSTFYWDLNDRTRAFTRRLQPSFGDGRPNQIQAGDYAAALHYLRTVKELGVAQARQSGRATVAAMKRLPTEDDCFGAGRIREDGRKIHPAYLFRVKRPEESRGEWDYYALQETVPAEQAFRPAADGHCELVRS